MPVAAALQSAIADEDGEEAGTVHRLRPRRRMCVAIFKDRGSVTTRQMRRRWEDEPACQYI